MKSRGGAHLGGQGYGAHPKRTEGMQPDPSYAVDIAVAIVTAIERQHGGG